MFKKIFTLALFITLYHTSGIAKPLCGLPVLSTGEIEPDITIHKDYSVREINRQGEGYLMLGKVDAQPYSALKFNKIDSDHCERLVIDFNIGYEKIDFYMPNDYKPGTCTYENIYAHEQKHLKKFVEGNTRAKAYIRKKYDALPMHRHVEINAQEDYERPYVEMFYAWSKEIFDQINEEQDDIDDPNKHQDEINGCNGDLIKETNEIFRKMKDPLP